MFFFSRMADQINSLVYDYLTSIGSKIADKFKKEVSKTCYELKT